MCSSQLSRPQGCIDLPSLIPLGLETSWPPCSEDWPVAPCSVTADWKLVMALV
eukprot:CAMPEP_0202879718 /NCGR_PEP_ID=MMETSP1391-20130828/34017_1 /ASSEMBLY_ACC=CAM_ASM_000867 /TAXON_ID=1034604 /ORGANISM="Chlamydomonas leiostraca, Strain SAG 11-49" /LENGTH=52 /DNA_ID=CAMNT_0049562117 /DNA_START=109 /DNA_END=267 /DNA_ORIENTATION=+